MTEVSSSSPHAAPKTITAIIAHFFTLAFEHIGALLPSPDFGDDGPVKRSGLLDAIARSRAQVRQMRSAETSVPSISLENKRVLISYLFGGLGDALLLTPAISALIEQGCATPVGVLAQTGPARLLKRVDLPLRLHPFTDDDALEVALVRGRYEIGIELTRRADVDALGWLRRSGASTLVGYVDSEEDPDASHYAYGALDLRHLTDGHWSQTLVQPMRPFGVTAPVYNIGFSASRSAQAKMRKKFPKSSGPRLLVIPGGRTKDKLWPSASFGEVIAEMRSSLDASVVVSVAPWEKELATELSRFGAATFSGKDLASLVELVRLADLVLTNDTGPMHIGFFMKKPTVAIFSQMSPEVWGSPFSDAKHHIFRGAPEPEWVMRALFDLAS